MSDPYDRRQVYMERNNRRGLSPEFWSSDDAPPCLVKMEVLSDRRTLILTFYDPRGQRPDVEVVATINERGKLA